MVRQEVEYVVERTGERERENRDIDLGVVSSLTTMPHEDL